jgi:hypothetical protein
MEWLGSRHCRTSSTLPIEQLAKVDEVTKASQTSSKWAPFSDLYCLHLLSLPALCSHGVTNSASEIATSKPATTAASLAEQSLVM